MVPIERPSYRQGVSTTAPDVDTLPPPEPAPANRVWRSGDRIVAGVAGGLADALGIAPLWTRLGFVVLGLFGGLGVAGYLAAFLLLPAGPYAPPASTARRVVGVAVVPLWLAVLAGDGRATWVGLHRPLGVALLLVGVAVALWRPRPVAPPTTDAAVTPPPVTMAGGPALGVLHPPRPPRSARRPRSPLGRIAFGLALVAAAVGTAITEGSSTGVKVSFAVAAGLCGVGLLIGVRNGRARWLIVPAVLFAAGSVLGAATEGLGVRQSWDGPTLSWSSLDRTPSRPPTQVDKGAGDVILQLDHVDRAVDGVIRLGHGVVTISAPDTVRLEIHARVGIGHISLPDGSQSGYRRAATYVAGPSDAPVIRYDVAVGFGQVEVQHGTVAPASVPVTTVPTALPPGVVGLDDQGAEVYEDGTRQLPDGTVILSGGTQILPDGSRLLAAGSRVLPSGEVLLADGTTIGPDGTVRLPSGVVIVARPPVGGQAGTTTVAPPGTAGTSTVPATTPIGGAP